MRLAPKAAAPAFVTPAPEVGPILADIQNQSREFARGFRPSGTKDWLMVGTLTGFGYVRAGAVSRTLHPGDLLLFAPDTPQEYGYQDEDGDWRNIWVHFTPRPHWLPWLNWPELAPGVMVLKSGSDSAAIQAGLRQMVDAAAGPVRLRHDLALNALERVLILCDAYNPLHHHSTLDPRIRQAIGIICENLKSPLDVAGLGRAVGLSRSRFSVVFRAEMNQTPQTYIEHARLARAAQLLALSGWSVGQVACESGFADPYYFSTRFRGHYGLAPSQYRQKMLVTAQ